MADPDVNHWRHYRLDSANIITEPGVDKYLFTKRAQTKAISFEARM